MKKVITTENVPIKLWLDDIEEEPLQQAKNLANLPFVFKHISIMPDSHLGYGMPIGGIMATKDVVVPNAVGVDIGCGMCAVKTSIQEFKSVDILKKIMGEIRKAVPVGFKHHKKGQDRCWMPSDNNLPINSIVFKEYSSALRQVGTLGGGNHFIEIQKGDDNHIWIMIHSGSRNIGFKVAKYYNDLAKELNETWYTSVPKEWQLAFLPTDSIEGKSYIAEMKYCVKFAESNRKLMMTSVIDVFDNNINNVEFDEIINIPHNYAELEHHFGKNVMVHRKGATKAYADQLGIVPGSQGTHSYIVKGKGETQSFKSCSHGAGRRMGRKEAQKKLNIDDEKKILNNIGVIHSIRNEKDLDEAPSAYKDIDVVMENQKDLVDIVVKLKPLGVIKG